MGVRCESPSGESSCSSAMAEAEYLERKLAGVFVEVSEARCARRCGMSMIQTCRESISHKVSLRIRRIHSFEQRRVLRRSCNGSNTLLQHDNNYR